MIRSFLRVLLFVNGLSFFRSVLDRLGFTYDYEFDWTPKLNSVVSVYVNSWHTVLCYSEIFKSTPSGSIHTSDVGAAVKDGKGRQQVCF